MACGRDLSRNTTIVTHMATQSVVLIPSPKCNFATSGTLSILGGFPLLHPGVSLNGKTSMAIPVKKTYRWMSRAKIPERPLLVLALYTFEQ